MSIAGPLSNPTDVATRIRFLPSLFDSYSALSAASNSSLVDCPWVGNIASPPLMVIRIGTSVSGIAISVAEIFSRKCSAKDAACSPVVDVMSTMNSSPP